MNPVPPNKIGRANRRPVAPLTDKNLLFAHLHVLSAARVIFDCKIVLM